MWTGGGAKSDYDSLGERVAEKGSGEGVPSPGNGGWGCTPEQFLTN